MKPSPIAPSLSLSLALVLGASFARAEDAAKPRIQGAYAFETFRPKASKCAKVTGALLTKLTKEYDCESMATPGAIIATCEAKRGNTAYMVLATAKDCDSARAAAIAAAE
jgi:hypothetical protein